MVSGPGVSRASDWVAPAETRIPSEVPVRALQLESPLDRERREVGVRNVITDSLTADEKDSQDLPMTGRDRNPGVGTGT